MKKYAYEKNDKEKSMKKDIKQMNPGKRILLIILFLLLLVFLFNLFKYNRAVRISDAAIKKNRSEVEAMQKGIVTDVEKAVAVLDDAAADSGTSSTQAFYKKKFRNGIVVGDSLTEGLSVYKWLSEEQVFSMIGGSVATGDDLFASAAKALPENAFFAFGMNDMGNYSGDEKAFIKDYGKRLSEFHKKSPDTNIYVCGLSTPKEDAIEKNSSLGKYKTFNKEIKKMCKKKGYKFIDIMDILPEHSDLYAGDGIHAQSEYYPYWLDLMIKEASL